MLKYYKEFLSDYQNASVIQTVILLVSIVFFVSIIYLIINKPKGYYKKTSELPLEDDDKLF